jgi:hypothetical protein
MDHIGIDLLSTFIPQLGLGVFIWYLLQGLSRQVDSLKSVVNAQKDTIEVMGRRIEETEKIGGIYKTLLADLPGELDNYKKIISATKDEVILQLQSQKAEAKQEAEDAKREIEEVKSQLRKSGASETEIASFARMAQQLTTKHKNRYGYEEDLDLKQISMFEGRDIGDSLILLKAASSFREYIRSLGFEVEVLDVNSGLDCITEERVMPGASRVEVREAILSTSSRDDDWLMIANDKIWLGRVRLERLEEEFAFLRVQGI